MNTQKNNKTQYKRPFHNDERSESTIEPFEKPKLEYIFDNLKLLMTGCMSLILIICMMICIILYPNLQSTGFEVLKSALLLLLGYVAGGKSKN